MRFYEFNPDRFKLNEDDSNNLVVPAETGSKASPSQAVKDLQTTLQSAGYNLGPPGIDGIRGPYTNQAITAFKKDHPEANVKMSDGSEFTAQSQGGSYGGPVVRNPVDPSDIASYLKSRKLTSNQILGILANIKRESNFDSGAIGDNGTSGGLFQHHNDRFTKMRQAAGGDEDWVKNWQKQIDFALSEPYSQTYLATNFGTPEDAVAAWVKEFEKPANASQEIATRQSSIRGLSQLV